MSGFINPFAQIGDYKGANSQTQDDLVTTGYLTGLPDPKQIADEQAGIIFKQLLKRDSRTKQRALGELEQWIDSKSGGDQIEDAVHLAYVQMYAKLSIDISTPIRRKSHTVLGKLYLILSKTSSKYLKYSVGPWLTSTYDPDEPVATAAKTALEQVFPNKVNLLVEKFRDPIQEFILSSCVDATAQSLSDERYVTKEEASQKYTRLVKCCLDTITANPILFDVKNDKFSEFVESGVVWKFFSSADALLARSALKLAQSNLDKLQNHISTIWKELLRAGRKNVGGPGVALENIQLMNILTKRFPDETWPSDEAVRRDTLSSLGQFILGGQPHPIKFWPLLYNLAMMIPEPPKRDLTPLYKPMEKTVLKLRYNPELEESAWGCYVSLAARMGPKYIHKVFKATETRCQQPSVPIQAIAKFLTRVADFDGVNELVETQLKSQPAFEYTLLLAHTHAFSKQLEEVTVQQASAAQLALLVKADNDLRLPHTLNITPEPEWLQVAIFSKSVDSQQVVEKIANLGLELDVLQNALALKSAGVGYNLDSFVETHLNDSAVLVAAVDANEAFLSPEMAETALEHLLKAALRDEQHISDFVRAVRGNPEFVNEVAVNNSTVAQGIEILAMDDKQGVLKKLEFLHISNNPSDGLSENSLSTAHRIKFQSWELENQDLSTPPESILNSLRALPPLTKKSTTDGLANCEKIAKDILPSLEESLHEGGKAFVSPDISAKLLIVSEFFKSWLLVAPLDDVDSYLQRALTVIIKLNVKCDASKLWTYMDSKNYEIAYHAAMAIVNIGVASLSNIGESFSFKREYFVPPTLKGAILAYFSVVDENVQHDNIQRSLIQQASAKKLKMNEYMLVDRAAISDNMTITINAAEGEDVSTVLQLSTFGTHVRNIRELAFESVDRNVEYAALLAMKDAEDLEELLQYAANLAQTTRLDRDIALKCLRLVNKYLQSNPDFEPTSYSDVESLIEREDSLIINWIGLQLIRHSGKNMHFSMNENLPAHLTSSKVTSWLIGLNFTPNPAFPEKYLRNLFEWISETLKRSNLDTLRDGPIELPLEPPESPDSLELVLNALYQICKSQPNSVREWYRDLRDKSMIKKADQIFSQFIIPQILRSVRKEIASETFGDNVKVSVNEKQREIRASREVEDEFTVEIVISLPEQYPGKPATISIKNLAGISEARKRGWLLETRQNIQNRGLVMALSGLLTRLSNFLNGIEPCAICYMTFNDLNKLPNNDCSQCHNIYHSDCLYKWFSTNGNKLCPMCRSPM